MIKREELDGLLHTYSDSHTIRQVETGVVYVEAWDIVPCHYTYEETDEPLPHVEEGQDAMPFVPPFVAGEGGEA